MKVSLPNNWWPREYQRRAWKHLSALSDVRSSIKRALFCWHRRSGKDDVMLHHNACAAFERVGNYWYMLPEYNQCRKAIWDAINPHSGKKRIDEAFPVELRANTLQQEMKIIFKNGSTWQLMGSDNYDALVGSPPVGLTFSEYGLSNPTSWGYLRPILLENKGWAIFNSTPRGKNHFYNLYNYALKDNDWFAERLTVDDTNIFTQEDLLKELAELQSEHGDDYGKALWLQEYYCSFEAAIPGAIWGDSLTRLTNEGRLKPVPHMKGYPVFTGWDLGRSDMTAIWFYQVIGGIVRFIDFYKDNFREIEDYCKMLRDRSIDREYRYGTHWLPHDADPVRLGMGGKSMVQQFSDYKRELLWGEDIDIGKFRVCPKFGIEDGIQAARRTFQVSEFDDKYCTIGFDMLKAYHRKYDEVAKTFSTSAVHDENSHPADAMRTVAMTWIESAKNQIILPEDEIFTGNVTNINFGQLKRDHFRKKRAERENKY